VTKLTSPNCKCKIISIGTKEGSLVIECTFNEKSPRLLVLPDKTLQVLKANRTKQLEERLRQGAA
jgi:hypothetical protein